MENTTFKAIFNINKLEKSIFRTLSIIEDGMKHELVRVYNMYADKTNGGITNELNEEFGKLYPNYFKDNKDKKWYQMTEYNKFMADGYQRLIVDHFNHSQVSPLLDFYVDPEEVNLVGYLRVDPNVTIDFYLKQI